MTITKIERGAPTVALGTALEAAVLCGVTLFGLLFWGVLGVVIGGRVGYALFYKPGQYLANPLEILMVWKGGMAFHGG